MRMPASRSVLAFLLVLNNLPFGTAFFPSGLQALADTWLRSRSHAVPMSPLASRCSIKLSAYSRKEAANRGLVGVADSTQDEPNEKRRHLSAQEKKMLKVLSERMKARDKKSSDQQPDGRVSSDSQMVAMENRRLQEKLQLRDKGIQEKSVDSQLSPFSDDSLAYSVSELSETSRNSVPSLKRSLTNESSSKGFSPKAKKVKDRQHDAKLAKSSEPPYVKEGGGLPKNLTGISRLSDLLDTLEPYAVNANDCRIPASDAVGALNRLKRLRHQATNPSLETRLSFQMQVFGSLALEDISAMSGKLISLTVNAIAHSKSHTRLLKAAGDRARILAEHAILGDVNILDVQAVSVILNGFARAGIRDEKLFQSLSKVAIFLSHNKKEDFCAQAISIMVNAFAKLHIKDEELFHNLASCALGVSPSDFSPQAIANIMNAYARHDIVNLQLFGFLSKVARTIPAGEWLPRHLAIVANALAKLEIRDEELLDWLTQAVRWHPLDSFDLQAVANLLNAFGKLSGSSTDRLLLRHLAGALRGFHLQSFEPSSLASSLHGFVCTGFVEEKLILKLTRVAKSLDPLLFDAQSVSTILHSIAKTEIRDEALFKRMSLIVRQMEFILESQSIALIINACAKVEFQDDLLLKHLSRIAQTLPPDSFLPQHIENILNGFAKLNFKDRQLFQHMATVISSTPRDAFDAQAVAIIMNAYGRMHASEVFTREVFGYLDSCVLPQLSSSSFNSTSIAIVLNSCAKAGIRADVVHRLLVKLRKELDEDLQLDGRQIASLLHAIATLNLQEECILDRLVQSLLALPVESLLPEEIALISWSSAVLNVQKPQFVGWLLEGLDVHLANMDSNFRRQAYQFLLTCELEGWLDPSRGLLKGKSRQLPQRGGRDKKLRGSVTLELDVEQHKPSRLQKDVAAILAEMQIEFVEEFIDERSGYSLDLLLRDKRTAIEVDGPSHFIVGTHIPLGKTLMKHRHMQQLGFDLRILPYWEWDQLKGKEQKKEYIRRLLTSTPSVILL